MAERKKNYFLLYQAWLGPIPLIQDLKENKSIVVITIFHNFQAKTTYYCLLGHQICRTLVWWLKSQEIQLPYAAGASRALYQQNMRAR